MDCLMGIDLGSTSLKAVAYSLDGRVLAAASRPTVLVRPEPAAHPEWAVWDPAQIWQGTADAIREAVAHLAARTRVRAVAVTGMGMDGVPVDAAGQWLYPFISWHDTRTLPQHDGWRTRIGAERTFAVGGNTLWYFSTALRLLWMREHEPEILARTDKWLLIEDFLNFMLCGRRATDYSMASCTLLFDQRTRDWSAETLQLAGIDRRLLCDAQPSGTLLGDVHDAAARATGLPAGTPVVLGGHDYLCGALPVGGFRPGVVLDVTGTWEIVLTATPTPLLTPEVQKAGMTVEAHVARNTYAVWGGAVAAGMLEWYRTQYGAAHGKRAVAQDDGDWDALVAEARQSPPGAGGVLFLPHLSGGGCPVVDASSRGAFVGLRDRTTRGDLFRAMTEGLDYQFLDIVRAMEAPLGRQLDRFVAVGGATRNEFWMQNKADVVGCPIEVPGFEEATPLGAALLAGIGVGLYRDEQDAMDHVWRPGRVYDPDPAVRARYADGYATYRQLYPALRDVHHRLAGA